MRWFKNNTVVQCHVIDTMCIHFETFQLNIATSTKNYMCVVTITCFKQSANTLSHIKTIKMGLRSRGEKPYTGIRFV